MGSRFTAWISPFGELPPKGSFAPSPVATLRPDGEFQPPMRLRPLDLPDQDSRRFEGRLLHGLLPEVRVRLAKPVWLVRAYRSSNEPCLADPEIQPLSVAGCYAYGKD